MTANTFVRRYSDFEDRFVTRFRQHQFWNQMAQLSDRSFIEYLLQVGVLSSQFVRWYEIAKLGIESETAREVIRTILRDEIPQAAPTHQDNRLYDLQQIGVSRAQALNVRPSWTTKRAVRKIYQLIAYPQEAYDLRVMVALRVAGEMLVAETYRYVVAELARRFGFKAADQRFYQPHFEHDLKDQGGEGHSDAFETVLEELITNDEQLEIAMETADRAFKVRYHFHDQFTVQHQTRKTVARITSVAASILVFLFLSDASVSITRLAHKEYERVAWRTFLQGLPPAEHQFYTEADVWLVEHRVKHGDFAALDKIGTQAAVHEVWGDGP